MIDSRHKMILSSGRFSGTSRSQLAAAFSAFAGSAEKDRLVVHFHGGLVNETAAEAIAERLLPTYRGAVGYPLFVIWQSGLLETLQNNWRDIVKEDVFNALVERVLQFVVGKLDQEPDEKGAAIELPSIIRVEEEIQQKQAVGQEPYDQREAEIATVDADLTSAEKAQLENLLANDPALVSAARKLTRPDAPEINPILRAELDPARAHADPNEKALLSTISLAAAGVRIVARVLKRYVQGRHHGVYTTVVEEVVRELKGALVGGIIWEHMKRDTAESFTGAADTHGGTAILEELHHIQKAGRKPRIVLVGHSAGAIYACHLLKKAAEVLPADIRFEVIFLAPACSFKLLDDALTAAGDRVAAFRSFGMEDALERKDAIFWPVYRRSLLYFVSGVTEEAVDLPLVGMKRYHGGEAPFDAAGFPEIQRVRDRVGAWVQPWIWSESRVGLGSNTLARKHGDFDDEETTLQSVVHLIKGV